MNLTKKRLSIQTSISIFALISAFVLIISFAFFSRANLRCNKEQKNGAFGDSVYSSSMRSNDDVLFVTFTDRIREEECLSFRSLWYNGVPLVVLGLNGTLGLEDGNPKKRKVFATLEYLRTISHDPLIVFNDASDVLFMPHLSPMAILGAFEKATTSERQILFAAERNCFPYFLDIETNQQFLPNASEKCANFPASPTTYKWLNAGNWAAKRSVAIPLLEHWAHELINNPDAVDDQHIVSEIYLENDVNIQIVLDFRQLIFQTMHLVNSSIDSDTTQDFNADVVLQQDGRVFNFETKEYPLILHFNGGKSTFPVLAEASYSCIVGNLTQGLRVRGMIHAIHSMQSSAAISGERIFSCSFF